MLSSHSSVTDWWIAAILSGIALSVAIQSMLITRKDKLKAALIPLAGAAFVVLNSAARGEGEKRR